MNAGIDLKSAHRPAEAGGCVRLDARSGPWPLHDAQASRAAEAAALSCHPPQLLMARAGLATARLALAMAPHARQTLVWCGPGNNGGDGLVAALHLHRAGKRVGVVLLADASRLPADAEQALAAAAAAGVPIAAAPSLTLQPNDIAIDALFGIGAKRPPQGEFAAAIAAINSSPAVVLAVDLPSGLNPDTGILLGVEAVRASATLALLTLKPGCHTGLGRDHAGTVWLDSLGCTAGTPSAWLCGPAVERQRLHASHKGSHGDVAVVGGAAGMVGAAWLAARAALGAGAGRVYCSLLDGAASLFDAARPELMGRTAWWLSPPSLLAGTTVVCGCGGGAAVREALPPLLGHARRMVLDADALNALAADPGLQTMLLSRQGRGFETVLTPHPLEAARLLQISAAEVQHDRLSAAMTLAERFGATVLLKGSGSIVATAGRLPRINPTGNAVLATAGTGDVLAGWLAGLWTQDNRSAAADVAAAAAWQHGRAADVWASRVPNAPLCAGHLVGALALREFD